MQNKDGSAIEIPAFLDEEREDGDWASVESERIRPVAKSTPEIPKPASFWLRLLAFEIDSSLLAVAGLGLSELLYKALGWFQQTHTIVPVSIVVLSILGICYFGFFESSTWKSTPGKRFLSLRVTTMRGMRITRANAFTRTLAACVCAIPLFGGFVAVLFTRKKQAWHDLSANTLVLRKPGESLLPSAWGMWENALLRVSAVGLLIAFLAIAASGSKSLVAPILADQQRRDRIETAIDAVKPLQAAIASVAKSTRTYPKKIDDQVFQPAAEKAQAIVVYNPANGVITLQFSSPNQGNLAVVSLYPIPSATGDFKWNCSAYGIDDKVLPETCKARKSKK